ncbi:class I SAM-dependent methyltransferase [Roseospira navarrensis]|uniref:Methyltransferase n=1 Tax=Roseospira navarrensis TaxID=140058 RepID=A0A7X1ZDT5_9PROT|nr:50S ribosomal protein L11 methyltransferase [Roseospira navarrensis]MQX36710.1 methyltransferase [Roseospira navarrensis]
MPDAPWDEAGRRAFVQAWTALAAPPLVPEVRLHTATEITPLWLATEEGLREQGLEPPFWAFAWPGGQALARYVLDHPDTVRGRRVLDLACGGGLIGLAAALSGAAAVDCVDVDPLALTATALNAAENGVADRITPLCKDLAADSADTGDWPVVLAGDVCYAQPMADRMMGLLRARAAAGALVLIADPGRAHLPGDGLEPVAVFDVPTTLELEDRATRTTTLWRVKSR